RPTRPTTFPYTTLFRSSGGSSENSNHYRQQQRHDSGGWRTVGDYHTAHAFLYRWKELSGGAESVQRGIFQAAGERGEDYDLTARSEEHTSELQSRFDLV